MICQSFLSASLKSSGLLELYEDHIRREYFRLKYSAVYIHRLLPFVRFFKRKRFL